MILFAYGVSTLGDVGRAGWLRGLKIAAVAVVACAVSGMAVRLCPDWPRRILACLAAAAVLLLPGAAAQAATIAACALLGWLIGRDRVFPANPARAGKPNYWAGAPLAVFLLLLLLLPAAARQTGSREIAIFGGFYRAGSLVFGGGHVVLPLLRSEVVPPGWIGDGAFLAGYGAAQALPGPLFSFAGYLGTVIQGGSHAWTGGILGLLAIFLPGWLLVAGAYPYWTLLRSKGWVQAALGGANAAVVGLLLAALYRPLCTEGIHGAGDAAGAAVAVLLLGLVRVPPWAVVGLAAAAGQWLLR
jgi:chromate transporter